MSIRVVLVDPNHPGNIGAVARAMKNMGLSELHLVRPKAFPHAEATARASGADDVVDAARVHEEFADAIADCGLVVGTSARQRHLPWDLVEPRECAQEIAAAAQVGNVAVVFGSEKYGLLNADLARCNRLVTIPTASEYASLNLAMAVQVIVYELWLSSRKMPYWSPLILALWARSRCSRPRPANLAAISERTRISTAAA